MYFIQDIYFIELPCDSVGKNLLAMQEIWVQLLGGEDPLDKEMATDYSISCLGNPTDRRAWKATYGPWGPKKLDTTKQ